MSFGKLGALGRGFGHLGGEVFYIRRPVGGVGLGEQFRRKLLGGGGREERRLGAQQRL